MRTSRPPCTNALNLFTMVLALGRLWAACNDRRMVGRRRVVPGRWTRTSIVLDAGVWLCRDMAAVHDPSHACVRCPDSRARDARKHSIDSRPSSVPSSSDASLSLFPAPLPLSCGSACALLHALHCVRSLSCMMYDHACRWQAHAVGKTHAAGMPMPLACVCRWHAYAACMPMPAAIEHLLMMSVPRPIASTSTQAGGEFGWRRCVAVRGAPQRTGGMPAW